MKTAIFIAFFIAITFVCCTSELEKAISKDEYVDQGYDGLYNSIKFTKNGDFLFFTKDSKTHEVWKYSKGTYKILNNDQIIIQNRSYLKFHIDVKEIEDKGLSKDSLKIIFVNMPFKSVEAFPTSKINNQWQKLYNKGTYLNTEKLNEIKSFQFLSKKEFSLVSNVYNFKNKNTNLLIITAKFNQPHNYKAFCSHSDTSCLDTSNPKMMKEDCYCYDTLNIESVKILTKGRFAIYQQK